MKWVWMIVLAGSYFAYRWRYNKRMLVLLLMAGVLIQGLMIYWYTGQGNLFWSEGLPLFHCRIAALMLAVSYMTKRYNMMIFFAWVGLVGALIAFSVPDPSPYIWPHVTAVTFVGSHVLLIMTGLMILLAHSRILCFKTVMYYTLMMNGGIMMVNRLFGYNYAYLQRLPSSFNVAVPSIVIALGMTMLMSVIVYVLNLYLLKLKDTLHPETIIQS